jgi:protein SCO1/2
MTSRKLALATFAAFVVFAGLTTLVVTRWRGDPATGGGGMPSIGGPFTLTDGAGQKVTDAAFRGKWMLLYFGYTHCPDACPTALNDMALALDKLGPQRGSVAPVFITIDPERDTPAIIKEYVASFGPDFVGLTGSPAAIATTEKEFRVYAQKHPNEDGSYDMDHSSIIYVMDPAGRFVTNFTHESSPDDIANRLRKLLS